MSNEIKKKIFVEAHALTKAYREIAVREGYAFDYRIVLSVYLKELFNKYKNGGDNAVALKSFDGKTVLKADAGNIKISFDCNAKQLKNTVAFKIADRIFFWDLNNDIIFSQENKLTEDKRELFTNALASVGYKPELEKEDTANTNNNNNNNNNTLNIISVETELPKTTVTVDNKYNVELYKAAGTVGVLCDFNNKKYYFNVIERKVFLNGKLQNEKCHQFFNKALATAGYKVSKIDAKYKNITINKCIKYKNKNVLIKKDKNSDIIKFIVDKNVRMIRLGESFTFCGARIYSKEDYNFLVESLRAAGYNNIVNNTNTNNNSIINNNTISDTKSNANNNNNSIYNTIISQTVIYNNYSIKIKKLKSDNNITFLFKNRMYNLNLSNDFITCNNKVQNTKCYEFFVGALKSIGYDINSVNDTNTNNTNSNNANDNNNNTIDNDTNNNVNNNATNNNNTNTKKPRKSRKPRKICIDSNEYMQMQFQI